MKRAAVVVGSIALAAVVGATTFALLYDNPAQDDEITIASLSELGLRLQPPDPDQPVSPRWRAERVAAKQTRGRILGSVLASCPEGDADSAYPCWVVAHDPAGYVSSGPPGMPRIPAAYVVSIIDSRTGAWIGLWSGGPADRSEVAE
jgi:hypothetical protein